MCGIFGYIGPRDPVPVIMGGLRSLEYRGYDSAGIAIVQDQKLQIRRCSGKLKNLEDLLQTQPVTGQFGLGHTRWATHGRPTEENAHPHRDCKGRIAGFPGLQGMSVGVTFVQQWGEHKSLNCRGVRVAG